MSTIASLNRENVVVDDGLDGKVIVRNLASLPGGATLDTDGFDADVIRAGHIVKHNKVSGAYAPLGVTSGAYDSLGADEEYFGVVIASVTKTRPFAGILTVGQVNAAASPYPVTDTIKSALPQIKFIY